MLSCCSKYVKVSFSRGRETHSESRCPGESVRSQSGPGWAAWPFYPSFGRRQRGLGWVCGVSAEMESSLLLPSCSLKSPHVLGVGAPAPGWSCDRGHRAWGWQSAEVGVGRAGGSRVVPERSPRVRWFSHCLAPLSGHFLRLNAPALQPGVCTEPPGYVQGCRFLAPFRLRK